jgi:hypothetical protein
MLLRQFGLRPPAFSGELFTTDFGFYKKGCQEKKLPRELEAAKSFGIQPPKSLCRWLEA